MGFMPLIWLRVAVVCYGVGLLYSLLLLSKKGNVLAKVVEPAVGLGLIFHFVSLVESTVLIGHLSLASIHYSESILAFLAMVVFFVFFVGYRTTSPGIVIFPIVFMLTFASAIGQKPVTIDLAAVAQRLDLRSRGADFYRLCRAVPELWREPALPGAGARLKSKRQSALLTWLPPLQTIDDICYHSLLFGFPFMTLGMVPARCWRSISTGRCSSTIRRFCCRS